MNTVIITDQDKIRRVAEEYCIPLGKVIEAREETCVGGYSATVLTTEGREGWQGCGHPRCQQCQYGSARGPVGDDAIRAFRDTWLARLRVGIDIPDYVRRYLTQEL